MKTFEIRFTGRRVGAIEKFHEIEAQVFAEDEAAAIVALYDRWEHVQQLEVKEVATPFDGTCLVERVQNTREEFNAIRRLTTSLRMKLDAAATRQARDNANWHDDPDGADHGLYHAPAEQQFTRKMRDFAILELVSRHLEVLSQNEATNAVNA